MGQRMPPVPHIYGDDCYYGFPEGKTPKYVYARFSNIVKCPMGELSPPNDRMFKLTQTDRNPCLWEYYTPPWHATFGYKRPPDQSFLFLYGPPKLWIYFMAREYIKPDEGTVYNSLNVLCEVEILGIGGIATVTWIHEATALLEAINMRRADDLFMEMRPLVDGNKVYKFCRLKDATNIKIEFEPN